MDCKGSQEPLPPHGWGHWLFSDQKLNLSGL